MSHADDLRLMIVELEYEIEEADADANPNMDIAAALLRLAELKDELEELERGQG